MNDYLSVTEFAKAHNSDTSWIRRMIAAGRIEAVKIGNQWAIPANAEMPPDRRIKSGKYINSRRKQP